MPKPGNIDDDKQYRIKVTKVIPITPDGRVCLSPSSDNVVKGSFLRTLADGDLDMVELVEPPQ